MNVHGELLQNGRNRHKLNSLLRKRGFTLLIKQFFKIRVDAPDNITSLHLRDFSKRENRIGLHPLGGRDISRPVRKWLMFTLNGFARLIKPK